MQNVSPEIPLDGVDTGLLASLIIELNTSHRFFKAYPMGHPVVTTSLNKVITRYEQLLGNVGEIIIAVAKDALIAENNFLDRNNLVFRDFAGILFEHGIGALAMRQGLTVKELKAFNSILVLKREEIAEQGGIEALWEKAHLSSLGIQAIRYDLFSGIEGDIRYDGNTIKGLWERFAHGLVNGTLGNGLFGDSGFDPESVADILNKRYQEVGTSFIEDFSDMLQLEEKRQEGSQLKRLPYKQIALFAAHLNPELRRHFLSASFDIRTIEGNTAAEEIVSCMLPQKALETLEELKRSDDDVPAPLIQLLEKLANSSGTSHRDIPPQDPYEAKMRLIFSEHCIEEHLASDSQHTPQPTELSGNQPGFDPSELAILKNSLDAQLVENQIGQIILRLAATGNDLSASENLAENLAEMCSFLLQTGDYHQLHKIIGQASDPTLPAVFRSMLADRFTQRNFLEEILNGLTIWGKSRYYDIHMLIEEIGIPFIEPLLDKLATEENMSLRRFIMERIQEFGPAAKQPVLSRIKDHRWYFLRNLLIMLQSFDDPGLAPHLRPLLKHQNIKVRQDALLCLLHYGDPVAERQLLRDLGSINSETKLTAINAAKKHHTPEVFNQLLAIISKSGLLQLDVEFKSAVIATLKEMGRIEALPVLIKVLDSSNLLRSKALTKLKIDVVRSLESYPPEAVLPILMARSGGHDEVALHINETLRSIRMKKNEL